MKTPPLLLLFVLSLWGWQTNLLPLGIGLGLLLESAHVIKARWTFSGQDFNRLWNLCTVFFLSGFVFAIASDDARNAMSGVFGDPGGRPAALSQSAATMLRFVSWIPIFFFPLAAAQCFSQQDRIDYTTFSWLARKRRRSEELPPPDGGLNITYPYAAACLLGASAAHHRPVWFFAGLSLVLAWALWPHRSRRFSAATWTASVVLVASLGLASHSGMSWSHGWLQNRGVPWLHQRYSALGFDAGESRTSIGEIGKLKSSGQIVLRLETDGQAPPALLREASYNLFNSPSWKTTNRTELPVIADDDNSSWKLLPQKESARTFRLAHYLRAGRGLLPLPHGSSQLDHLPAVTIDHTPMGAVRIEGGPGLANYRVDYDEGASIDSEPEPDDLSIPPAEGRVIAAIAEDLQLGAMSPEEAVRAVTAFFADNFSYSTYQDEGHLPSEKKTALMRFLTTARSGHCEHFASATVLLLRQAGIPARYAVGYSVQEGNGRKFVVRDRHAHAWTLAFLEGAWRDLDTTPASWNEIEQQGASWREGFADFRSRLWFEFQRFRWDKASTQLLFWLPIPLLLWFGGRLYWKRSWKRTDSRGGKGKDPRSTPGWDSEFFKIERKLRGRGFDREPGETTCQWVQRIEPQLNGSGAHLRELLTLHYQYRFDPRGLSTTGRQALQDKAAVWLKSGARLSPRP